VVREPDRVHVIDVHQSRSFRGHPKDGDLAADHRLSVLLPNGWYDGNLGARPVLFLGCAVLR